MSGHVGGEFENLFAPLAKNWAEIPVRFEIRHPTDASERVRNDEDRNDADLTMRSRLAKSIGSSLLQAKRQLVHGFQQYAMKGCCTLTTTLRPFFSTA